LITIFYTFITKERYAIQRYTIIHKPTKVRAYFFRKHPIFGAVFYKTFFNRISRFYYQLGHKAFNTPFTNDRPTAVHTSKNKKKKKREYY